MPSFSLALDISLSQRSAAKWSLALSGDIEHAPLMQSLMASRRDDGIALHMASQRLLFLLFPLFLPQQDEPRHVQATARPLCPRTRD
jgi:hypothetical protein